MIKTTQTTAICTPDGIKNSNKNIKTPVIVAEHVTMNIVAIRSLLPKKFSNIPTRIITAPKKAENLETKFQIT